MLNTRTRTITRMAMRAGAVALLGTLIVTQASAQATPGTGAMKEDRRGQLARARVTPDSARHLARQRVAGATIAAEEIEEEGGKLVYSFDMRTPGKSGIDEVLINALTGAIISVEHEGPKQEAAERAADMRKSNPRRPAPVKP